MDCEVVGEAEADDKILTFDIPGHALERAASAEPNVFTVAYCTHPWYHCGLPQ
jgi:hypothetical protein